MSEYKLYTEEYVEDIAAAIRAKTGTSTKYQLRGMAAAIDGLVISEPDWTQIGYDAVPDGVMMGFEYAQEIQANWNPNIPDRTAAFMSDYRLVYFPHVNTSNIAYTRNMFHDCTGLQHVDENLDFSNASGNVSGMFSGCTSLKTIKIGPFSTGSLIADGRQIVKDCVALVKAEIDCHYIQYFQGCFNRCFSLEELTLTNLESITSMRDAFYGCVRLGGNIDWELPNCVELYEMFNGTGNDTEGITIKLDIPKGEDCTNVCYNCTKLTEVTLTNTSHVTTLREAFLNCSSLVTVSIDDTSSVTNFLNTFSGCTSLSDESLNNILKMCIDATSYIGTKTLVALGITATNYPAEQIEALDNYADFVDAGWSTGYDLLLMSEPDEES